MSLEENNLCGGWRGAREMGNEDEYFKRLEERNRKLEAALDAATDIGIYPKSVVGGESPYEKRTDYMEGWNAALLKVHEIIAKSLK